MSKTVKFQSEDVSYPGTLYFFAIWGNNESKFPIIHQNMFEKLDEMFTFSKTFINELRKHTSDEMVMDYIIVIECKFESLYPLHKSMWLNHTDSPFTKLAKDTVYYKAILNRDQYKICVTPVIEPKGDMMSASYKNAFAFLKGSEKDLDALMSASDVFVTPEAKHAAIFTIEDVYGYDLVEEKIIDNNQKN